MDVVGGLGCGEYIRSVTIWSFFFFSSHVKWHVCVKYETQSPSLCLFFTLPPLHTHTHTVSSVWFLCLHNCFRFVHLPVLKDILVSAISRTSGRMLVGFLWNNHRNRQTNWFWSWSKQGQGHSKVKWSYIRFFELSSHCGESTRKYCLQVTEWENVCRWCLHFSICMQISYLDNKWMVWMINFEVFFDKAALALHI